jgi:hypothetical protein
VPQLTLLQKNTHAALANLNRCGQLRVAKTAAPPKKGQAGKHGQPGQPVALETDLLCQRGKRPTFARFLVA